MIELTMTFYVVDTGIMRCLYPRKINNKKGIR